MTSHESTTVNTDKRIARSIRYDSRALLLHTGSLKVVGISARFRYLSGALFNVGIHAFIRSESKQKRAALLRLFPETDRF